MGVGGLLTVLAFASRSGETILGRADCEVTGPRFLHIACSTTSNKGLLVSGLGAVGVGALLYMRGENRRSPSIAPIRGGVFVQQQIEF